MDLINLILPQSTAGPKYLINTPSQLTATLQVVEATVRPWQVCSDCV